MKIIWIHSNQLKYIYLKRPSSCKGYQRVERWAKGKIKKSKGKRQQSSIGLLVHDSKRILCHTLISSALQPSFPLTEYTNGISQNPKSDSVQKKIKKKVSQVETMIKNVDMGGASVTHPPKNPWIECGWEPRSVYMFILLLAELGDKYQTSSLPKWNPLHFTSSSKPSNEAWMVWCHEARKHQEKQKKETQNTAAVVVGEQDAAMMENMSSSWPFNFFFFLSPSLRISFCSPRWAQMQSVTHSLAPTTQPPTHTCFMM